MIEELAKFADPNIQISLPRSMLNDKDLIMSYSGLESNFGLKITQGKTKSIDTDYKTWYERKTHNVELQEAFDLCATVQFSAFN